MRGFPQNPREVIVFSSEILKRRYIFTSLEIFLCSGKMIKYKVLNGSIKINCDCDEWKYIQICGLQTQWKIQLLKETFFCDQYINKIPHRYIIIDTFIIRVKYLIKGIHDGNKWLTPNPFHKMWRKIFFDIISTQLYEIQPQTKHIGCFVFVFTWIASQWEEVIHIIHSEINHYK